MAITTIRLGHHHSFGRSSMKKSFEHIDSAFHDITTSVTERMKLYKCLSIFMKSPRVMTTTPYTDDHIMAYTTLLKTSGIKQKNVVSHAGYGINLAHPSKDKRTASRKSLLMDISCCVQLGITKIVIHPGSWKNDDYDKSEGLTNIANELEKIARTCEKHGYNIRMLLENVAIKLDKEECARFDISFTKGKTKKIGSIMQVGWLLTELGKRGYGRYFGFCMDTAHLHASGYNVSTRKKTTQTLDVIFDIISMTQLKLIHLNDNDTPRFSGSDHHVPIGTGHNGLGCFKAILNHPVMERRIIIITETHEDDMEIIKQEYKKILSFVK
jgi:endonuclease IV